MARPRLYSHDEHHRLRFSDAELISMKSALLGYKEGALKCAVNAAHRQDLETHYRRIIMKLSRPLERRRP